MDLDSIQAMRLLTEGQGQNFQCPSCKEVFPGKCYPLLDMEHLPDRPGTGRFPIADSSRGFVRSAGENFYVFPRMLAFNFQKNYFLRFVPGEQKTNYAENDLIYFIETNLPKHAKEDIRKARTRFVNTPESFFEKLSIFNARPRRQDNRNGEISLLPFPGGKKVLRAALIRRCFSWLRIPRLRISGKLCFCFVRVPGNESPARFRLNPRRGPSFSASRMRATNFWVSSCGKRFDLTKKYFEQVDSNWVQRNFPREFLSELETKFADSIRYRVD